MTSAREKNEKKITPLLPQEIIPDPNLCLLEQGLFCAGRDAVGLWGALSAGWHGLPRVLRPNEGVVDHGAKI